MWGRASALQPQGLQPANGGGMLLGVMANMIEQGESPQMLELWAGIEATVNRVGDRYFDQLAASGHATRIDDLYRLAELGVRAVRYPVLWERTAPERDGSPDWRWADE